MATLLRTRLNDAASLTQAELGEWFLEAANECWTGTLEVRGEYFTKRLSVVAGRYLGFESDEPADALDAWLRLAGLLKPAQFEAAAYVERRTGRGLVDILRQTGAVASDLLDELLHQRGREAALGLCLWDEVEIEPSPGDDGQLAAEFEFGLDDLLAAATARRDAVAAHRARFAAPEAVFVWRGAGALPAANDPENDGIVELLQVPRTLLELQIGIPAGEFALLERLDDLLRRGLAVREDAAEGVALESVESSEPGSACLLESARRAMETGRYEQAIELFRAAEAADPMGDERLTEIRATAEEFYAEAIERDELPVAARPLRMAGCTHLPADCSPLGRELLARADGSRTVATLVAESGAARLQALSELLALKRRRLVDVVAA